MTPLEFQLPKMKFIFSGVLYSMVRKSLISTVARGKCLIKPINTRTKQNKIIINRSTPTIKLVCNWIDPFQK
jgi:hypothetical protein